jgi:hypothetical protein
MQCPEKKSGLNYDGGVKLMYFKEYTLGDGETIEWLSKE